MNSPQSVTVLLNVQPATHRAVVFSTGGLILSGVAGSGTASGQVSLFNPSSTAGTYTTAIAVSGGGNWLSVSPSSGPLNTGANVLTVQASLAGLVAGVYSGTVALGFDDGSSGAIQVGLVVTSTAPATGTSSRAIPSGLGPLAGSGCTSDALVVIFRQPVAQATAQAGVAQKVQSQIVDSCANALSQKNGGNAQVVFSNGDSAVTLQDVGGGVWEGTWTPANASAGAVILRARASKVAGIGGGAQISLAAIGKASATGAAQPLAAVNSASGPQATPLVVVPGSYVSIYGNQLADSGSSFATTIPLPSTLNNTQLLLGGTPLPLSYAAPGQVNGLIPLGLNVNASFQLVVRHGATQSVPLPVTVAALQPGIYTIDSSGSGPGVVQIANTTLLAQPEGSVAGAASRPVESGAEYLTIYANAMGPVTGKNGEAAPGDGQAAQLPAIFVTAASVTATIGGVDAPVVFSGLAPTFVALYQVNVQVPAGVPTGDAVPLVLTVTDGSGNRYRSNSVTIAVQ